jgi:hypothetical protein
MISQEALYMEVKKSTSFRFGKLVKILTLFSRMVKFNKAYSGKSTGDYFYLTICNRESIFMVKVSLHSFLKHTDKLPTKVIIISDGSWDAKDGERLFADFSLPFIFESWETNANYHNKHNRPELFNWANKQIWGKKLAAILQYAESSLVLFSDPDVLWYKNIVSPEYYNKSTFLKVSIDNSHNYDDELITNMKAGHLYDLPPVNCGVLLIKGDMFQLSRQIIPAIKKEAENPGKFSEQTIIAMMVNEFGELWTEEEVTATIDDILSPVLKRSQYSSKLIARHYLWRLKWLYWRDFLFYKKSNSN